MKKFDLLVFIGRFQPFHMGHQRVIDEALEISEKVLILLGSAGSPRTLRNPFTYEERVMLIQETYLDEVASERLFFRPIYDKTYNDPAWISQVQNTVKEAALTLINPGGEWSSSGLNDIKIGLIGHQRDNSSYYLKLFPQYESVAVKSASELNATYIRKILFDHSQEFYTMLDGVLPKSSANFLYNSQEGMDILDKMAGEYNYIKNYKKQWENSPYPPTFNTVDALVEQSGHILLIRRRSEPGKGLWALPGGFKNVNETQLQGMIRELREETKIKVPDKVLLGSIINTFDADDPNRSDRGCVISKVFHIKLADDVVFPKVKGLDDADKAKWTPISSIKEENMFEDHYHLIMKLLGI